MAKSRAVCIFTTLLGNNATTRRLREVLNGLETIEPVYVPVEAIDFRRFPAPAWARTTDAWESQYVARRKAAPTLAEPFDMFFVNCWEFVTAFRSFSRRVPAAVLMDAVPATVNEQLRRRVGATWKRALSHRLHDAPFARAIRSFSYCLPMGSDAAEALRDVYGFPEDRCATTLAPQDLDVWKPHSARSGLDRDRPFRLLFVANDFKRKGGDFLLRLYSGSLASSCTLNILSNDPLLERMILPAGVKWKHSQTREQVLDAYRESDLFVFPTLQDFMPQVLAEALSTGVPCIATDVGGIRDLVRDGETGFLMPQNGTTHQWAEKIESLRANRYLREDLSTRARSFAEQNLGIDRFTDLIRTVVERLAAERR